MGKRGPKPQSGKRQPKTGRLSQALEFEKARVKAKGDREQWNTMSTALMARNRMYGLPFHAEKQAGQKPRPTAHDQNAGSLVGRMVMQGELSRSQGDAAFRYCEDVDNYRKAISAPKIPGAVNLNAVRGASADNADHEAFVRRATLRYLGDRERGITGSRGAVSACQCEPSNRGSNLFAALDYMVLRDEYFKHMMGDLRIGLNALVKFYRFVDESEAA